MKIKTYIFMCALLFVSHASLSQTIEVSEIITNEYKDLLAAVSVSVKGSTNGTSSDLDGNYSLSVSQGDILVYSYVGYSYK